MSNAETEAAIGATVLLMLVLVPAARGTFFASLIAFAGVLVAFENLDGLVDYARIVAKAALLHPLLGAGAAAGGFIGLVLRSVWRTK
jgi:hypothetical protein